jgi:hypothetical protein
MWHQSRDRERRKEREGERERERERERGRERERERDEWRRLPNGKQASLTVIHACYSLFMSNCFICLELNSWMGFLNIGNLI